MAPRNILTLAGALAALALLISMPFAGLVSAEPTEVGSALDPPYSFSQSHHYDIHYDRPKGLYSHYIHGDYIHIETNPFEHWTGGWLNSDYTRHIEIKNIEFRDFRRGESHSSITVSQWSTGMFGIDGWTIRGNVPVTQTGYLVINWELVKTDHFLNKRSTEDSGEFTLQFTPPVRAILDVDGYTSNLVGRNSITLPHQPMQGRTHVGWDDGGRIYAPGSTYTTRSWDGTIPTITAVYEDIPPEQYTVTLNSDPPVTVLHTTAGDIPMLDGVAIVDEGTIIQMPTADRDRHIIHRWMDAQGNAYDWSRPLAGDITLTAEWYEHYDVEIANNRATVTINPALPESYQLDHLVDWGDGTINTELTHTYAAAGDYTIIVSSQRGGGASSSTSITIEDTTETAYRTIHYNTGGAGPIQSQTVEYGTIATAPADPSRTGYEFVGWYNAGVQWDWSTPITVDVTLTAGWLPITPGGDDNGNDFAPVITASMIAIGLTIVMALLALVTRHPAAIGLTVIMAVVTIALEVIV